MMIHPYLQEKKGKLIDICRNFGIKELYAFGSVVRKDFSPSSDVDFLVEFKDTMKDPIERFDIYLDLKRQLEDILDRKVDILQEKDLTNPFLKHFIFQEKEKIYAEA
jgi:uncharacterized protein